MQARFCRGSLYLGESHGRTFARKPPKSGQHAIWRITFVSVSCLKDVANSILFIAQNCFRRLFRQSCDLDSLLPANQPLIQIPFGELLQEYFKPIHSPSTSRLPILDHFTSPRQLLPFLFFSVPPPSPRSLLHLRPPITQSRLTSAKPCNNQLPLLPVTRC